MNTVITCNVNEGIKQINNIRLQNKNKWYFVNGVINGYDFTMKAYNTWVQIINIKGYKDASNMDISVKEFKDFLIKSFS